MSASNIYDALNILIKVGLEIKNRLDSLNQAAEDLQLLTINLKLLLMVFENPVNEDIMKAHVSEFVNILDVLQSIANSCAKCAKALDIDLAGETASTGKTEALGKKILRRVWTFNKIPSLLAEIQRKAEHLQKVYSAVSVMILQDIQTQQGRTSGKEIVRATTKVEKKSKHEDMLNLDFNTNFAST